MDMEEVVIVSIELTEQQQQTLDAFGKTPARVIDPRTSDAYVLIPAAEYEAVREALEDERQQRAIRAAALRNAARGPVGRGAMIRPGEVYMADIDQAGAHPVIWAFQGTSPDDRP